MHASLFRFHSSVFQGDTAVCSSVADCKDSSFSVSIATKKTTEETTSYIVTTPSTKRLFDYTSENDFKFIAFFPPLFSSSFFLMLI